MDYNIKFIINEKVKIPKIHKDLDGHIIAIFISECGITYKVRYFWESKPTEVYLYDSEIEKIGE